MSADKLWRNTALIYVDNGQYYAVSWRTPDKEVWPNPFMLAWVTNVSTSPDLNIEFSTGSTRTLEQTPRLVENFVYEAAKSEQSD